jgi:N-acetylglucosaminyl-diphospho-decaprenol L-rhamnosyltransferase
LRSEVVWPAWAQRRGHSPTGKGITLGIDVIVVTFESADTVAACLAATSSSPLVERVIVVDNASADGSASEARRAGADFVVQNPVNEGFACAVNVGLRQVTAEHVLLLNPDALLKDAALSSLHHTLSGSPASVIAAPLLRDPSGDLMSGAGKFATVPRRVGLCVPGLGRASYFAPQYPLPPLSAAARPVKVDYVFGAAMLVERAFLERTLGLDERFFLFAEDEDICRQARASGRDVLLDPRAVADHVGGASCSDEPVTEAQRLFSTHRLLLKWHGPRAAAAYRSGILGATRLRSLAARVDRDGSGATRIRRTLACLESAFDTAVDPLRPRERAASPSGACSVEGQPS